MVKLYIYFFLFVFCISAIADDNYYKILDVDPTASAREITQAYRRKARRWHPDRNPGNIEQATEYMQKINRAYEVLGDARQRAAYDASFGRYTQDFGFNTTSWNWQPADSAKSRADQQAQDLRDAINENQPLSAVKKLLDEGADPNARGIFGKTPLYYSLLNGNLEIARLLMEHGADINFQNSVTDTVLIMLIKTFDVSNLELSKRKNILKGIKFALENEADPNAVDVLRRTPLYHALLNGNLEIARLLMENGVDINFQNSVTADTVLIMLIKTFDVSNLELSKRKNILKGIKFALENKADPNAVDVLRRTPLCHSLMVGDFEIARLLMEHGADINFQNSNKDTVLHLLVRGFNVPASEQSRKNILKGFEFALENGADPNAVDFLRRTALYHALLNGNLEIARLLVEYGADINFQNSNKETVLHLLVRGFNVPASEQYRKNILKGIEFALENKVDSLIPDESGETVVDQVKRAGYSKIRELMESYVKKDNSVSSQCQKAISRLRNILR